MAEEAAAAAPDVWAAETLRRMQAEGARASGSAADVRVLLLLAAAAWEVSLSHLAPAALRQLESMSSTNGVSLMSACTVRLLVHEVLVQRPARAFCATASAGILKPHT